MRIMSAGAAVILLLLSVGACSSTKSGKGSSTGPGAASSSRSSLSPSSSSPPPSSPPPSTAASSSGAPLTEAQVQAALLTAGDVPGGFTDGTFVKADKPQLCAPAGSPSFRQQTSPQISVGTTLDHAGPQASLNEQIFVYADAAAAQQALAIGKKGLDCTTGTVYYADGSKEAITISAPMDAPADLAADSGFVWQLRNASIQGTQVAVTLGRLVVTLSFVAVSGADVSKLPSALAVTRGAIGKIKSS